MQLLLDSVEKPEPGYVVPTRVLNCSCLSKSNNDRWWGRRMSMRDLDLGCLEGVLVLLREVPL